MPSVWQMNRAGVGVMTRYEEVAATLRERIEHGIYRVGDRLPSIRAVCQELNVSISTAQEAYRQLMDAALIESRPKSGYFVLPCRIPSVLPSVSRPAQCPLDVSQWDQVLELVATQRDDKRLLLGRGVPKLSGSPELRQQVARLAVASGCLLHPDDVLITTGCQEALSIALRTLTQPGDVVAVDSPSFYGTMQILKANGLKALEIPTDPQTGISLEALELALEQWPIRAIQVTPTYNNPLGYTMPEARKRALYQLAQRFDVAIIEDDIYGDLAYTQPRPLTIKSFDTDGRVLLCSGFSKTLGPGLRVGWLAPGCYREKALHMKYVSTGASATLPQLAVAEFVAKGHFERHLRAVSRQYQRQRDIMISWVQRYFPKGSGISYPQGGFLLWVELPADVDCVRLNERLAQHAIHVAPGALFSASGKFRQCLRLNYAFTLTPAMEEAVRTVGELAREMLSEVRESSLAMK